MQFKRYSGDASLKVEITTGGTTEIISVSNRLNSSTLGYGIEQIVFSDGITLTLAQILEATSSLGTATAETMTGSDYADRFWAKAGNDTVNAGCGDDVLT